MSQKADELRKKLDADPTLAPRMLNALIKFVNEPDDEDISDDPEFQRISALSEEEVTAELEAAGIDPKALHERMEKVIAECKARLDATKESGAE